MTAEADQTRREFLRIAGTCSAHLALMAAPFPLAARSLWSGRAQRQVVAQEAFGRLESWGEGLWALVSTPLNGDYTTVCNGGIIAGSEAVLVFEAFQTEEGARWMAEQARNLTGRWPTHVLISHYHGDHSTGAPGFIPDQSDSATTVEGDSQRRPDFCVTATTRDLKAKTFQVDTPTEVRRLWADVVLVGEDVPETLDLGQRVVNLVPRQGHTPSDVTLELPEEGVLWSGDLIWNGMFPNYMDAIPSQLSRAVRALGSQGAHLFVPGHGPLADSQDLARYTAVIDGVEETARRARREGWTAEEAAARHTIPGDLGEWTLFNPSYFQRAVEAWMREWGLEERISLETPT